MRRTLAALVVAVAPVAPAGAVERIPAVLHVHSSLSTGHASLLQLAAIAEQEGIGALLLAENYLLRLEHGLPPFRALTRVRYEEPSILTLGVGRYLAEVDEVRRAFPRLVIVPGVEVMPHYRWGGSPWSLAVSVHGTQKNLLVFGVTDPEALRRLPVTGNPHIARYGWRSLAELAPVLLALPGAALVLAARRARRRARPAAAGGRAATVGTLLCVVALVALVRGWPFTVDPFPPHADLGLDVHQELIDHVDRAGGVTVWSLPEARDSGSRRLGPVTVTWETAPYADDLLRSFRYTAFGGLYDETTRFERPGEGWDRLLREYVGGERRQPAWAVGEAAFHGFGAGKKFANTQTVFLADARSGAAVLAALRRGRLYALRRAPKLAFELAEFTLSVGPTVAGSGDTLVAPAGTAVEARIAIDSSDGARHDVRVALVRNGVVAGAWSGATPLRVAHRETFDGQPAFFRVDVRAVAPHRLLTSPIFLRSREPSGQSDLDRRGASGSNSIKSDVDKRSHSTSNSIKSDLDRRSHFPSFSGHPRLEPASRHPLP